MTARGRKKVLTLTIHGATGRVGRRLIALAAQDAGLRVVAAITRGGHPALGMDAFALAGCGGKEQLPVSDGWPKGADGSAVGVDAAIDFSTPTAMRELIRTCVAVGKPLVIGTTGLSPADHAAIDRAAKKIAVLQSPNMSLGVNLLFSLAAKAAQKLGPEFDIEIVEAHHHHKKDAPSGTALGIAKAICDATNRDIRKCLVHGREGKEAMRRPGEIGVHAMRMGDVVGEHRVYFGGQGERLELAHAASSRDVFAHGALVAAKWLAGREAGRYTMADVLGLHG